ncbi:MAG: hypothetical protein COB15_07070 [Flavobacteriales bacterium]|nr:MAG: hypothetical protein COB15_07070 [Flavobacteriales bacterium]
MLDTTSTEKDENTLKNVEIRSKDWLENSPVCTKVVDPNFNLQYMSRAGIEALNIKDVNLFYGKSFPLDFYPEEFRKTMFEKLQDSKDTGEVRVHEGMIKTDDDKELWFESTISPIYDKQGKLDYFMVVSMEISERIKANAKDLLLKEIHHRIKNNLQIVSSLLSLQVTEIDNPEFKRIIENSKQRISAISLVHEKMYDSDVSGEIFVKPYIEDLVSNISSTYIDENNTFDQDIKIDNFKLDMDVLVPCSLILNEILTNIFKYGFKSNPNPSLRIHVNKKGNEISMIIADNGAGIIKKEDNKKRLSLGMKLIKALAIQINANIHIDSSVNKGVCYTIKFNA